MSQRVPVWDLHKFSTGHFTHEFFTHCMPDTNCDKPIVNQSLDGKI